jgi:hypothetical protein
MIGPGVGVAGAAAAPAGQWSAWLLWRTGASYQFVKVFTSVAYTVMPTADSAPKG